MALWYKGTIELQYNGVTVKSFLHYFKWIQAVNDLPNSNTPSGTIITNDFTYVTSRCDEPAIVGGTILNPFVGDWNVLEKITQYISQYDDIPFATTGNYTIKFILPSGKYAIQNVGTTPSLGSTTFYESDGTTIGSVNWGIIYGNVNYTSSQSSNNGGVSMWFYKSYNGDTKEITPNKAVSIDYRPQSDRVYYTAHTFTSSEIQTINTFFGASTPSPSPTPDNPYSPGGTSEPGGGIEGSYALVHDVISIPEKPALSAVSTGFVSIWTPTEKQVVDLARYMWNADLLTVDFWRKLVADPIDLIYSLAIFPCEIIPDGNDVVCVGLTSTGVRMDYYNSQYFDVNCGTVLFDKYWDAYLDYSPYTKVSIYLPFIGVKPLNVDEVIGDRIQVKYRIDLASGVCVAFIRCGDSVLYQFSGNCATQIPVTSMQFADLVRSAVTLGTAVGASIATAGAAGPAAISAAASLATSKPDVAHSGAIGNAAGLMAVQRPYLIVSRPRQAMPENQEVYTGFPSFIREDFSLLEGYTEVEATHLHGIPATQNEIEEIENLLKSGVIF